VVQCPTDRAALAQAYYGAGRCYRELGRLSKEGKAVERSVKMFETVRKDYPDSPEYLLAEAALGKGG